MNPREAGFLLLTSRLGNPERKILSVAQLRRLASRAANLKRPKGDEPLTAEDLISIGYSTGEAKRILSLLSDEDILAWYLNRAKQANCVPITRISRLYPHSLRQRLGSDCPACLWTKGDISLLCKPAVALVGSRDLNPDNLEFAKEAGKRAAKQGLVLISGNARGADKTAQNACLANGGQVISVVADPLKDHPMEDNILYISEEGFDSVFSAQRAISRNRVIHCLANQVLVAQSGWGKGGTWDGVTKNLRNRWSNVLCYDDGSAAVEELIRLGAQPVTTGQLEEISCLTDESINFF